jgi:hypothetical protein
VDPSFRSDPRVLFDLRGPQDVFHWSGVDRPGESQRPGETACAQRLVEAFDLRMQVRAAAREPTLGVEDQDRPALVAVGNDASQLRPNAPLPASDTGSHRLLPHHCWR